MEAHLTEDNQGAEIMQKATYNQLANTGNRFQTDATKVLCVCSAGLLRSPTLANVLHQEYGCNTRACGTNEEFALIPMSEALIAWADLIVFVEKHLFDNLSKEVLETIEKHGTQHICLNIPDRFPWNDEELRDLLYAQYFQPECL